MSSTSLVKDRLATANSVLELPLFGDEQSRRILNETALKQFQELPETAPAFDHLRENSSQKKDLISYFKGLVSQVFRSNSILLRFAAKLFPDMSVNFVNHDIAWDKVVRSDGTPPGEYISPQVLFES